MDFAKSKELFKKAYSYNWDNGNAQLLKIIRDENCDKATAVMIFWLASPAYYYERIKSEKLASYEQPVYDLAKEIAANLEHNMYQDYITYTYDYPPSAEEKNHLPSHVPYEVKGVISYMDVLYPKTDFSEAILDLCKNCDDVSKMHELAAKGADFTKKLAIYYPVQVAINFGQAEALQYFVDVGYSLNQSFDKQPLLFRAISTGRLEMVRFLLENGADVNVIGNYGDNALHHFARIVDGDLPLEEKYKDIVRFLVEKGVAVDQLDGSGRKPEELAALWNKKEVIAFLLENKRP